MINGEKCVSVYELCLEVAHVKFQKSLCVCVGIFDAKCVPPATSV